ncbi:unnamed protein product, partial [Onchocerca ochengi]|uniref:Cadherin domain-containing protein n=1 Tax=Onchocerca ochengi TaxID=42157 RepID=A0A182EWF6_ONCOC
QFLYRAKKSATYPSFPVTVLDTNAREYRFEHFPSIMHGELGLETLIIARVEDTNIEKKRDHLFNISVSTTLVSSTPTDIEDINVADNTDVEKMIPLKTVMLKTARVEDTNVAAQKISFLYG